MPRKKVQPVEEEPTELEPAAETPTGSYVALSDFSQRYIVEISQTKGPAKEEVHTLTGEQGKALELPEGWRRDLDFEQIVFMKRTTGATFILPTGKRVTLPVKES